MKKVFALALTVLMVMSMFAGCGSSNTAKERQQPPKSSHNSIQEIEEKARSKEHQHDRHRKNSENPE